MKIKVIRIASIAAVLVAAIVAVVIFWPKSEGKQTAEAKQANEASVAQSTIATPYCELKYPTRWEDQMTVQETEEDGATAYVFYALIEGKQYELYTIRFGDTQKGDLFGYLPGTELDIPVYIECHSVTDRNDLTEAEMTLYYTMMESVNEIAQSIAATDGYYKP